MIPIHKGTEPAELKRLREEAERRGWIMAICWQFAMETEGRMGAGHLQI